MTVQLDTAPQPTDEILAAPDLGAGLLAALDGAYHDERVRVRNALSADDVVRDHTQSVAEARAWTLDRLVRLSNNGFGRAGVPDALGGTGTIEESVAQFEVFCAGDMSLAVKSGVQHGLYGGAIFNLGNNWHHETYLAPALRVEQPGCFAMTEFGHGSDVSNLETTITYDDRTDEYVVHSPTPSATKTYLGNAAEHAQMAVVFGQLIVGPKLHGIHVALVRIRDEQGNPMPGVTLGDNGHKGGLLGVDNGTISFDSVRVPRTMLLDRFGGVDETGVYRSPIENANRRFFTMLGTLVRGRICIGGGAMVGLRKGLTIATTYAQQRRQFPAPGSPDGVVLLDYLAHQRKLLPAIATAYAYGFAQNELIELLGKVHSAEGADLRAQRRLETFAAGMKAMSSRYANDQLQVCREACGGAGYMTENGLTGLRQDVDVFATFEGDNTVLFQLVAKQLLGDYRESWVGLDPVRMVQASAKMIGGDVIDRTLVRPMIGQLAATAQRQSTDEMVSSRSWQRSQIAERERIVITKLALRLQKVGKQNSKEAFEAVNRAQDHMIYAARVHMERVIFESFINAIDRTTDAAVRRTLDKLADLYILSVIEADRGWFLERNRISPNQSKALTRTVNQLCAELRPIASDLVEGLGIPTDWLGSEMIVD